ncbi:MAG: CHAT domain-containing protein [Saprospiraceae bacterium]|nr:CHAT domain-containing protein [Saprospiraceae bacterium]
MKLDLATYKAKEYLACNAFKIAGAKYLMMSLWQVPDEETKEFMISFYKNWLIKNIAFQMLSGRHNKK